MFAAMSVCHSVHRGSDMTIIHDALDLTVQPTLSQTWDMGPHAPSTHPHPQTWALRDPQSRPGPLLLTSAGHHWRPVETCSLQDSPSTDADI